MSSSEESEDDFESAESDEETSSDDTNSSASRPTLNSENSKFIEKPSNTEVECLSSEISLASPFKSDQSGKEQLRVCEGFNDNEDLLTAGTSASQTNNDLPALSVTLDTNLVIPTPKLEHSLLKVDYALDISNSSSNHLDNIKEQSEFESEITTESTTPSLGQQVSDLISNTERENETTIKNKISTRSVSSSSRGRSKANKPSSLGAKKLGAVKLSPESSSDTLAATFGKLELTSVDPVPSTVTSSSTVESRHQVRFIYLFF